MQERVLKLAYPCYVRSAQGRIAVACVQARSGVREAFLDPARIRKVLLAVEEGTNAILLRGDGSVHVFLGNYRIENGVVVSAYGRKLDEDYVKAWIGRLAHYIVYESDHSYYAADLDWQSARGEVIKEGGLELLRDVTARVRPCGKGKWRAHLSALGRWDEYCFDLATVFRILETNVHPFYGVMD
ncbi:MAG: hypothetical protein LM580_08650 [Thermofilum sp.]|nr:hypothetical protein [Thermofilum sp.]